MLVLSENEVRGLIEIEELIRILEQVHVEFSAGKAVMPVRQVVPLPRIKGRITTMPGYLSESEALGMKVVTYFAENPMRGLPAILGTVSLYSPETGKIIALMGGSYITAVRTAAVSAVATKALANPDTPVMGVLGAGVQARAHIRALSKVRRISEARIYSPSGKSARAIREELEAEPEMKIVPVASAEEAARGADVLVTVSTAKEPILRSDWLKPGVHISAVGSHRPDLREIDGTTLKRATVVVDSREAIMAECGDILLAVKEGAITEGHIRGEIGEVLSGAKPGRRSPSEITLYKSVGIAIQDVATAHLVYEKALARKVGKTVEI